MNPIDLLNQFLKTFKKEVSPKGRQMKRVFQLRRYLEWHGLTAEEKLSVKRLFFVPIVAFFLYAFINKYIFTFAFLICLYLAYKKFEKGKLTK